MIQPLASSILPRSKFSTLSRSKPRECGLLGACGEFVSSGMFDLGSICLIFKPLRARRRNGKCENQSESQFLAWLCGYR